jgi:hypothetical protein
MSSSHRLLIIHSPQGREGEREGGRKEGRKERRKTVFQLLD